MDGLHVNVVHHTALHPLGPQGPEGVHRGQVGGVDGPASRPIHLQTEVNNIIVFIINIYINFCYNIIFFIMI